MTVVALAGIDPAVNAVAEEIIAPVRQVPVRLTGLLQAWLYFVPGCMAFRTEGQGMARPAEPAVR